MADKKNFNQSKITMPRRIESIRQKDIISVGEAIDIYINNLKKLIQQNKDKNE